MIKIKEYKEPQHNLSTEKFFSPKSLYLPLSQHTGKPSSLCVKEKEVVEESQLIAEKDALISSNLHSPKKGVIFEITDFNHPVLKKARTIILESQAEEKEYKTRPIEGFSKGELLKIIEEKGIVGMGGAAFPASVKLNPPKKVDTLIINGCECEPYLACDYRLMVENIEEIFKGIEIICKIIEPREVFFAIEDNKEEAIKNINLCLSLKKFNLPKAKLVVLKTAYPQGGEKQLIYSITKRKVPPKGLPFDVGCLVQNVATCFAIYEAVYLDKPLIERIVSFCGDALKEPKNLWVKIGTTLSELFERNVLQFKKEPKKIICGGPMMGTALDGLDYPILKATGGFLFLSQEIDLEEETSCIRCARCVDICPMQLLPLEFVKRVKIEDFDPLEEFNIVDCIECGSCAYVCPAKIPLVHYIRIGKKYAINNK